MYQQAKNVFPVSSVLMITSVLLWIGSWSVGLVSAETNPTTTRHVEIGGASTGDCTSTPCESVEYAFSQSNSGDEIIVGTGAFTVTKLELDKSITLRGGGIGTTIIQSTADYDAVKAPIFNVTPDTVVTITHITIRNGGKIYGMVGGPGIPAIMNRGSLSIIQSELTENGEVMMGAGAIFNGTEGILHIQSSNLHNNIGTRGGAISNHGILTIDQSTIAHNFAAPFCSGDCFGIQTGGGIFSTGVVSITNSQIYSNSVRRMMGDPMGFWPNIGHGGGIYQRSGTLFVLNSEIYDNHAGTDGYAHWVFDEPLRGGDGGGIYIGAEATARIENSAIYSNTTGRAPELTSPYGNDDNIMYGGNGGGIANFGVITTVNTLIHSNQSSENPSGKGNGGGIWNSGTAYLLYTTIVNNDAGLGGGVYALSSTLTIENSVIANNSADSPSQDCYGPLHSNGYSLIATITDCDWAPQITDLPQVDPLFESINVRNSQSRTLTPMVSSPLVERIPATSPHCVRGTSLDQRGLPRAGGNKNEGGWQCDIGSVEIQYIEPSAILTSSSTAGAQTYFLHVWFAMLILTLGILWRLDPFGNKNRV